ncbi:hypothetical protein FOL47_008610 [Perkinsus chesapeaki]|uniref:DnaJ homolog subfamily C member 16 n=1 Tax=Perkinsus chesapeaki TaxID=330153 RepID=A0A7J6MTE5_PERCH|nr:hypothetical protein FOL47_008610 [Perkinsus chesapeaki]
MPKKSRNKGGANNKKKEDDIKEVDVSELVAQLQSDGSREGLPEECSGIVPPPSGRFNSRRNKKGKKASVSADGEPMSTEKSDRPDEAEESDSSFVMVEAAGDMQDSSDEDKGVLEGDIEGEGHARDAKGYTPEEAAADAEGTKKLSKSKQRRLRQREKEKLHGSTRRAQEEKDGREDIGEEEEDNLLTEGSGDEAAGESSDKRQKKTRREPQAFAWSDCKWLLYVLPIIALLIALKMGEEAYQEMGGWSLGDQEEDYYQVLNVDPKAKHGEIRNAYRKLAMKWHPDKNPDCDSCLAHFQSVAKAYETLGDENKRKVYDTNRGGYDSIPSDYSTRLTTENYHSIMDHSVDIWIVEVYSDLDKYCHHIAPAWDEVASDLKGFIKFGRINSQTDRGLFKSLPITPRTTPTIFRFMPAHPEIPPSLMPIADINPVTLKRWILDELPVMYTTLETADAAEEAALASDRPVMVLRTRAAHTTPLLKAMIYKFSHAMRFLVVNGDHELQRRNDIVARLLYGGEEVTTRHLKTRTIEETLSEMMREVPLEINQLNVKELCRPAKGVADSMKIYCVLLGPKTSKAEADDLVVSLRKQKATFRKFDPSDVDIDVQLGWGGEQCAEQYGDAIVLEYETQRYAALKDLDGRVPQLFTDLSLGDLVFHPLRDHIGECLDDPRKSRFDAVMKLLSSKEAM